MPKIFTDDNKWKKPWFRKLTAAQKCLWLYLIDNSDHAGIFDFDEDLTSFMIGESVEKNDLDLFGDKVLSLGGDKFWLVPYVEFQYGELKEEYNPHKPAIKSLMKYNLWDSENSRLAKDSPKALQSLMSKSKNKSKNKSKDKSKKEAEILIDSWNQKKIICHKQGAVISKIEKAYNKAITDGFSHVDITEAVENYSKVLHSDKYFWTHKWGLDELLSKGYKFFPGEFDETRFLNKKQSSKAHTAQDNMLALLDKFEGESNGTNTEVFN